jgi:cytochrome c556
MPWETVKDVTLILFSVGALVIALWCLFFMVPVKRFWERMEALGGGLKGIEGYVDEVHKDLCQKLSEMETMMRQQVSQAQESTQEAVEQAAEDGKAARNELDRLRGDLQALQAELRDAAKNSNRMTHNVEALSKRLSALQDEFVSLDVKLERSVKQRVMDSFKDLEATVLSALDAIQEEMLGKPRRRQDGGTTTVQFPRTTPLRNEPSPRNAEGNGTSRVKIEPLFENISESDEPESGEPEPEEPVETAEAADDAEPEDEGADEEA